MGNLEAARKLRAKLAKTADKKTREATEPLAKPKPLDKQNREELVASATALGIEIKDETKAQIIELIKSAEGKE
jgi:hypothetical protein